MWVVTSNFGDGAKESERILACGQSYIITRKSVHGRELYFKQPRDAGLRKRHAFLEVEDAPVLPGAATQAQPLTLDWKPKLTLRHGEAQQPLYVLRAKPSPPPPAAERAANPPPTNTQGEKDIFSIGAESGQLESIELQDGDSIKISLAAAAALMIKVKWISLALMVAPPEGEDDPDPWLDYERTVEDAASVGIPITLGRDWNRSATHLVASRMRLRPLTVEAHHAGIPFVSPTFAQSLISLAVDAEKAPHDFGPEYAALDPYAVVNMPEVVEAFPNYNQEGVEQNIDELLKTFQHIKAREKPLFGRTILCFTSDNSSRSRSEQENITEVFKALDAEVIVHSLTASPISTKKEALTVIQAAKTAADRRLLNAGSAARMHVQLFSIIIFYMGGAESLQIVGAAAQEQNIPMPRTVDGDLDFVIYGLRDASALLETYTGNVEDYIDPSNMQHPEGNASNASTGVAPPQIPSDANDGVQQDAMPPMPAAAAQPPADGQTAPVADEQPLAGKPASHLKRTVTEAARPAYGDFSALFAIGSSAAPARPSTRKKTATAAAAASDATGAASAHNDKEGMSSKKTGSAQHSAPPDDFSSLLGLTSSKNKGKDRGRSAREVMMTQLRAGLDEEIRTQAHLGSSIRAGTSSLNEGTSGAGTTTSEEPPLTPLVEMEDVQAGVTQTATGKTTRKRTGSESRETAVVEDVRGSKRSKQGQEENDYHEGDGAEAAQAEPTDSQATHKSSAPARGTVGGGRKPKANDQGPDKDEQFLMALSTLGKGRKNTDEYDKEFNQLRIVKPSLADRQRTAAHGVGGGKGLGRAAQDENEDEEFQRFKEMAEDDLDCNLRGNFIHVDFVPLVVKHSQRDQTPLTADGRPNFKAFRRKGQPRPVFDPTRVVGTVTDAVPQLQIGEDSVVDIVPKRSAQRDAEDDEEMPEGVDDDVDFSGIRPTARTSSGSRTKATTSKFKFTLGDEDTRRATGRSNADAEDDDDDDKPIVSGRSKRGGRAAAGKGRGSGRGRGATQYVEISDDEEEGDSDPEAGLLLNLDEEQGLCSSRDRAIELESQFSLDSQTGVGSKRKPRAAKQTVAGRMLAELPDIGPSRRSGQTSGIGTSKGCATASTQSQLFRGVETLDPLGEEYLQAAEVERAADSIVSENVDPTPRPVSSSLGRTRGPSSTGTPSNSVVPASRSMDPHEEDTFMGFGMSGRRRRGGASGTASSTTSSRNAGSSARTRSRF
ncbi:hypothetical protein OC846_003740 [Tilletia horrida]|uniref:Uncharacterized protein n=1 Tax=Tilletia horrida TaxID=155126 RepID=A0AAN6GRX8_9BASI|nr:hypothetical protein OC845_003586 [Tilletia horrida]KAK0550260.1 hypothetical protein OC846_003740 [Tilletia horrida]KAK0565406.1 hypothetical protein OC861_003776 [Tilletia horrida]